MSVNVYIPTPLRGFVEDQAHLEVEGESVEAVLAELTQRYPALSRHLYDGEGNLRQFVNLYVNDEDIRYLEREKTALKAGDSLSIVPAIAGGVDTSVASLSRDEIRRYSRHLIIPEVGMAGQQKLKQASVLCIGAGGLGSPVALYLAAAGVGRLGMVDFDVVDFSNLQRQVLHSTDWVGRPKLESAKNTLEGINPHIEIDCHETRLSSENALSLFQEYDLVVDGTDNFPTRYLVNDACLLSERPNMYASIFRFEGQASIFAAPEGPCYRCLYPEPPPPGLVPSCAEGGVLGILPGLLGLVQATEAIKWILGIGEPLVGRLLLVDALGMNFRQLKLKRDPNCPACGDNPSLDGLIDYELFCGISEPTSNGEIAEITAQDLKAALDRGEDLFVLDVRTPSEYQICQIPGSKLIPLDELLSRVHELDTSREIVVHCKSGVRSARAIEQLQEAGFAKLRNLKGGILEWAEHIDPEMAVY